MNKSHGRRRGTEILWVGDRNDSLFAELVARLAEGDSVVHWPENGPLSTSANDLLARAKSGWLVVHRRNAGPAEVALIRQLRQLMEDLRAGRPRLELILGEMARYSDVQEMAAMADRITPESVAADVFPIRVNRLRTGHGGMDRTGRLARVGIMSRNLPMVEMLADCLAMISLEAVVARGWSDPSIPSGSLMVWDVPTLNPRWEAELKAWGGRRPVLALLAMASRDLTARARAAGACACLDLPFELNDLHDLVLAHLPAATGNPAHEARPARPQARGDAVTMRSGSLIVRAEPGHAAFRGQNQRAGHETANSEETGQESA